MNTLPALLMDLGRAGIELAAHGDRLRHRPSILPGDLSARLRMHRAAVLSMLTTGHIPADDDAAYTHAERLGVADDLDKPTHPGSPAWLIALAEAMGGAAPGPPAPTIADRLAGIVEAVLGVPVLVSTLPRGQRFPGEPEWGAPGLSTMGRK